MCTVSHCHTMLQGHYPYRRCERHRLQNRHHSKLKRVRDKEVKSTPFRSENTQDLGLVESSGRKGKARAPDSLYSNEPLNLDARALDVERVEGSEVRLTLLPSVHTQMVTISMRTSQRKAPFHLLLEAPVAQIRSVPSSGVRTYFTIAHHGRCVRPIGRKIA